MHIRQTNLILHTETPPERQASRSSKLSPQKVVGMELGGKSLWLAGDHSGATPKGFSLAHAVAGNIFRYFADYYTGEGAETRERNCFIGAAAMTGEGYLTGDEAYEAAERVMLAHRRADRLPVGSEGVIGYFYPHTEDEVNMPHAVVGLSRSVCIQTEHPGGPISIDLTRRVVHAYRDTYASPGIGLYI